MHPPGANTVLVRHGDLNTKTTTVKRYMEELLAENLEALLSDRSIPGEIERRWNRPLIHTDEDRVDEATAAAADTFGVVSASPAVTVSTEKERLLEVLEETARACYDGGTFAVEARRADKTLPWDSEDLAREGGTAIWEAVEDEFEPEVDLDDPDVTFGVEVRKGVSFVYLESVAGPGGLPLGAQEQTVAMISGGIDSPVAAYEMMRRGSPIVPVYVDLGAYGGIDHEARAMETVRTLADYAPNFDMQVYTIPAGETVDVLVSEMEGGRMLSLRRFFYRAGEVLAERVDAHGIVTGEAIGQKSSQTAQNIGVVSRVASLPIHRPLLSCDKHDIVEQAREIGTFTDSTIDVGCNLVAPDRVETNARLERLLENEPDDLLERAEAAAKNAELVEP
ncbi:tRNA sulfurtransferase [Natronobacterium gregoryi]|uniref:Probable tRNA sulfurtransferase n=2 Tax=Natronobacterium gregoryi TaxID=44930 RepID=L0AC04_NATGS|nr:THUMP domain-containing protein [Natronobacterium gregoryi]AFZ71396.1 thiamine biosynthesis ATP pyrophosphatase [Natronobacterium gregoryi SP2]ELY66921.1 thiamine biosynthesis protein [Natronobacterium gregoryi SP2]PLK21225.1 tRNA sulfurtransferase [Natronobacterium gregoryi SP2]SFI84658.1 thiamine biosynthesis protein ThiI [Natronobacterium gregoryi]